MQTLSFTRVNRYISPPPDCPYVVELKNAKYQFRIENGKFKIPNLRYIGLFSQSIVFKTRIVKHCSFRLRLKLSQLRSMLIFYTYWKHKKTTDFLCFQGAQNGILTRNGLNNNNISKSGMI